MALIHNPEEGKTGIGNRKHLSQPSCGFEDDIHRAAHI